jgi:oligopeptide transport system substrate-binding protein
VRTLIEQGIGSSTSVAPQNMDYPDANNFLNDGVHRPNFGNWHNATYESLLDQAAREQNPDTRKALYKQAEEILVETDAVMLPLYYYTSVLAVKGCVHQ